MRAWAYTETRSKNASVPRECAWDKRPAFASPYFKLPVSSYQFRVPEKSPECPVWNWLLETGYW